MFKDEDMANGIFTWLSRLGQGLKAATRRTACGLLVFLCWNSLAGFGQADLVVTFFQDGTDAVIRWDDGAGGPGSLAIEHQTVRTGTEEFLQNSVYESIRFYPGTAKRYGVQNMFGMPNLISANVNFSTGWTVSGDHFGILNQVSDLSGDYVYATDFSSIQGEARRTMNVEDLGLNPGTLPVVGTSDTIRFVSAIPEPTSLTLFGVGIASVLKRRRKRRTVLCG